MRSVVLAWAGAVLVLVQACARPPPSTLDWAAEVGSRVSTEWATSGALRSRWSVAPADLVIFHTAEQRGSLDTCGCPQRPRGSLGRFAGWVDASQKAEPSPSLLVHAGYFFADAIDYMGQPRPDAMEMNGWMARGLDLVGFDAINVSAHDVLGLADVGEIGSLPLVSANVSGPGIKRWVVVERGGIRIGVTGVTAAAPSMAPENGYLVRPLSAALPLLAELADQVQVVVLLSWGSPEELDTLLRAAPGIDVVVEANLYPEGPPASLKRGAVRTYSTFQGVQAGELRVDFHEGEVVGALDRRVNLDDVVPARETVSALMSKAKPAIDAVQRSIYGE